MNAAGSKAPGDGAAPRPIDTFLRGYIPSAAIADFARALRGWCPGAELAAWRYYVIYSCVPVARLLVISLLPSSRIMAFGRIWWPL